MCETELNEQAKISLGDDSNQNNRNCSETISSQLHATFHSDSEINNKVRSLNLKKKKILISNIVELNYMSKLRWGILQSNQHYFISFFQPVEAVVNHIYQNYFSNSW